MPRTPDRIRAAADDSRRLVSVKFTPSELQQIERLRLLWGLPSRTETLRRAVAACLARGR